MQLALCGDFITLWRIASRFAKRPHSAVPSLHCGAFLTLLPSPSLFLFIFFHPKKKYYKEREEEERERRKEEGGSVRGSSKVRNRSRHRSCGPWGPIPDYSVPHLEPLERSVEWSPALKVLTGHKSGAPTPRKLIINEL